MAQSIRNAFGWLVRYKAELLQFGLPFAVYESFNLVYDKIFFSYALLSWGPLWGAIIPVVGAFILNPIFYWLYEFWGARWIKEYATRERAGEGQSKFKKWIVALRIPRSGLKEKIQLELKFSALLLYIDPVIVAIFFRETQFKGISGRDWIILFKATAISCAMWLGILEPLIALAKLLWHCAVMGISMAAGSI